MNNKDLDLGADGSLTTGNAMMNNDGVLVDDGTGSRTSVGAGAITVAGAGNSITVDAGAGTMEGLSNRDLDAADFGTTGRAATEEQLELVNQTASAGWNVTDADGNSANIGPNGQVSF
ncbi:autotransporter adhesin, partial [Alcanivorax xiamenensis]